MSGNAYLACDSSHVDAVSSLAPSLCSPHFHDLWAESRNHALNGTSVAACRPERAVAGESCGLVPLLCTLQDTSALLTVHIDRLY